MNNCAALTKLKYSSSKFTWWNGRIEGACIFKRLDRVLCNQEFTNLVPSSEVSHLIRQGSVHAPLHVSCNSEEIISIRPFNFLNFWTKHPKFKKIIKENWKVDFMDALSLLFRRKSRRLKVSWLNGARKHLEIFFSRWPQWRMR